MPGKGELVAFKKGKFLPYPQPKKEGEKSYNDLFEG